MSTTVDMRKVTAREVGVDALTHQHPGALTWSQRLTHDHARQRGWILDVPAAQEDLTTANLRIRGLDDMLFPDLATGRRSFKTRPLGTLMWLTGGVLLGGLVATLLFVRSVSPDNHPTHMSLIMLGFALATASAFAAAVGLARTPRNRALRILMSHSTPPPTWAAPDAAHLSRRASAAGRDVTDAIEAAHDRETKLGVQRNVIIDEDAIAQRLALARASRATDRPGHSREIRGALEHLEALEAYAAAVVHLHQLAAADAGEGALQDARDAVHLADQALTAALDTADQATRTAARLLGDRIASAS